jgi:hypothetical protein
MHAVVVDSARWAAAWPPRTAPSVIKICWSMLLFGLVEEGVVSGCTPHAINQSNRPAVCIAEGVSSGRGTRVLF